MKVVVCDEQLLFAEAFAQALRRSGNLAITTSEFDEALAALGSDSVDIGVIGIRPVSARSLAALAAMRRVAPDARLICLGPDDDPALSRSCADAGADLVLSKKQPLAEIVGAVLGSWNGVQPLAMKIMKAAARRTGEGPLAAQFLTKRERDVLRLLVAAASTRAIAKQLGITVPTARGYIQSTFTKLGVHSRVEAVTYALVNSIIDL